MLSETEKKELVARLIENNILVSADFLENPEAFAALIKTKDSINKPPENQEHFLVIQPDLLDAQTQIQPDVNWAELERFKVRSERETDTKTYSQIVNFISNNQPSINLQDQETKQPTKYTSIETPQPHVEIITSYDSPPKKREIEDFVSYFNSRFKAIEGLLRQRAELSSLITINRLVQKKDRETVSLIGIIIDKKTTQNGNVSITIEDQSGSSIQVIINKNRKDLYEKAQELVVDEVIGVVGVNAERALFATNILHPDIPITNELKKAPEEAYAVFLSDLHVGSKTFLPEEFSKFLSWIRGEIGDETQRKTASKIKYLFIIGDIVDGVGIYPGQESELSITSVIHQYQEAARLIAQIPSRITIIICPGNHDAVRLAEPQPVLYKDFAEDLWKLPNVVMVSNPSLVNIHKCEGFEGFKVLLYHGFSFDYYVANVDAIRNNGGYDRADLIMTFLLKRRHLAPSHTSTLYVPDAKIDSLVINTIPDFFATGHIHKTSVSHYRNVTLICGSCWQSKTAFQEKVGHNPEPCRVPLVNLKTRKVKILRF